jgi:hypothetical protein
METIGREVQSLSMSDGLEVSEPDFHLESFEKHAVFGRSRMDSSTNLVESRQDEGLVVGVHLKGTLVAYGLSCTLSVSDFRGIDAVGPLMEPSSHDSERFDKHGDIEFRQVPYGYDPEFVQSVFRFSSNPQHLPYRQRGQKRLHRIFGDHR